MRTVLGELSGGRPQSFGVCCRVAGPVVPAHSELENGGRGRQNFIHSLRAEAGATTRVAQSFNHAYADLIEPKPFRCSGQGGDRYVLVTEPTGDVHA